MSINTKEVDDLIELIKSLKSLRVVNESLYELAMKLGRVKEAESHLNDNKRIDEEVKEFELRLSTMI